MAERVPDGCEKAWAMGSVLGVSKWAEPSKEQVARNLAMVGLPLGGKSHVQIVRVAIVPLDGRFKITKAPKRARRKKNVQ